MTLIECFDPAMLDNIACCLHLQPEKLILLGKEEQMGPAARRYRSLLQSRKMETCVILKDIGGLGLTGITDLLQGIVLTEDHCVIDLRGGDELVVMAVGAMLAGLDDRKRKKVSVQKYDPVTGKVVDCDGDGQILRGKKTALDVEEIIALHGGIVHPESYQPPMEHTPEDVASVWDIVSRSPSDWNRSLSVLGEFEKRSENGYGLEICLPLERIRRSISNYEQKEQRMLELLEEFDRRGIVTDRSSRDILRYSYSNPLLRYCTQKAGNVLEIKALLEARAMEEKGSPYFQDCRMGVTIDWDGIVHDIDERIPDTRNEIDLILMRGLRPLFVSCKNGTIGEDELYKLHTVATRFGGMRAGKMLIATDLNRKSPASDRAFIQRARDMGVYLVTDAAELSDEEWRQAFKAAME